MAIVLARILPVEENVYDVELIENDVPIVFRFLYRPDIGGVVINGEFSDYLWDRADAKSVLETLKTFIRGGNVTLPMEIREDRTGDRWV